MTRQVLTPKPDPTFAASKVSMQRHWVQTKYSDTCLRAENLVRNPSPWLQGRGEWNVKDMHAGARGCIQSGVGS
ncbi:hypothetical protein GCM10009621_22250 [Corynebacterium felinum]